VDQIPILILLPIQIEEYQDGKLVSVFENGEEVRVYNWNNDFCAIYTVDLERGLFTPMKMFI
jgi:dTDP-D-glucose 4,6-dehydratase